MNLKLLTGFISVAQRSEIIKIVHLLNSNLAHSSTEISQLTAMTDELLGVCLLIKGRHSFPRNDVNYESLAAFKRLMTRVTE